MIAFWRLLRMHKPVGILLLWCPTAWALWCANRGFPPIHLFILFLIGTVLMRAAGCVINDIADRNIDKHVMRTKDRPLPSGELSLPAAFFAFILLLLAAFLIVIQLPVSCFYFSLIALLITILYPFCKRFLRAPQMVLGLAFSMGIPMAYVGSQAPLTTETGLLLIINFLWIVAYDTMYAMVDKEDDLKIGVNSTAIYFSHYDGVIIAALQISIQFLWLLWAAWINPSNGFYWSWLGASIIMGYQHYLIKQKEPAECFKAFKLSIYYGLIMWLALSLCF